MIEKENTLSSIPGLQILYFYELFNRIYGIKNFNQCLIFKIWIWKLSNKAYIIFKQDGITTVGLLWPETSMWVFCAGHLISRTSVYLEMMLLFWEVFRWWRLCSLSQINAIITMKFRSTLARFPLICHIGTQKEGCLIGTRHQPLGHRHPIFTCVRNRFMFSWITSLKYSLIIAKTKIGLDYDRMNADTVV